MADSKNNVSKDADNGQSAILEEYFYNALATAVLDPQFENVIANIALQDLRARHIPMSQETPLAVSTSNTVQNGFVNIFTSLTRNPAFLGAMRGIMKADSEDVLEPLRDTRMEESGSNGQR